MARFLKNFVYPLSFLFISCSTAFAADPILQALYQAVANHPMTLAAARGVDAAVGEHFLAPSPLFKTADRQRSLDHE
jgi:hypothetical protein